MMQTTSSQEEAVEMACTAFQKRVHVIIKKYTVARNDFADDDGHQDQRLAIATKEAYRCTRHANHVLLTLTSKLRSLENAITAFREVSGNDYIQAFSSSLTNNNSVDNSATSNHIGILYQWFANYLRLRDGFVLFESGECRHKHDVEDTSNTSTKRELFPSRLQFKPKHKDGYTQTYSSKMGYTGYGLDEFNDEDVGIRRKLLDQLLVIRGVACNQKNRDRVWNHIIDKCEIWDTSLDQVNAVQKSLRDDLTNIQAKFVTDINQCIQTHRQRSHNNNNDNIIGKLTLVTEDKAERISFGSLLDVCREGDKFTLADEGGSLPIGMSLMDWKKKFSLPKQPHQQVNKKRRRVIKEESSDDDGDDLSLKKKKSISCTTVNNGLVIRERKESSSTADANNQNTFSLDEIKRQEGVSVTQLEQGFDQLEDEEFKSTMAANEDDVKEGFLADFGATTSSSGTSKIACPRLASAIEQLILLRKNKEYQDRYLLDRDIENLWLEFITLINVEWKEAMEGLMNVRLNISLGTLEKSSDEAYDAREKCREVIMLLGIHCMNIHEEFLTGKLSTSSSTTRNTNLLILSSFNDIFSETDYCFLLVAEEAFKTALRFVMEQEDCHKTLPDCIGKRFEKGQHFLQRGRAQHNIGLAFFEQSQSESVFHNHGENRKQIQRLLKQSSKEFEDSMNSANLCRGNTTAIYSHADAGLFDRDSGRTWTSNAMRQSFEAMQLISLTSRWYGVCLWELGEIEKAENIFCRTADLSDFTNFLGDGDISSDEIANALHDPYWCAMTLADVATGSLEDMPVRGVNEKKGNEFIRVVKLALQQARLVSDKIFALLLEYSIENRDNDILTREKIDLKEKCICDMWEKKKAQSQKNIPLSRSSIQNDAITAFPRRDVGGLARKAVASDAPRKIFIQDGTLTSSRRSRAHKNSRRNGDERQTVSENFNDAFGVAESNSNFDNGRPATSNFDAMQPSARHGRHLKWGDELLEEHERNRYPACCPPLPPNTPLNVKLAITAKLGDMLPIDDNLAAKLYA